MWVCTGMWYHKNNKSSKNKYNNNLVYLDYLAKEMQEGKGFIPVVVTPSKTFPAIG